MARGLAGERYLPSQEGTPLQIPIEGFLDDVLETHGRFCSRQQAKGVNPDTRPSVYGLQPYRREGGTARPCLVFSLRTCEGTSSFAVDYGRSMVVAAWMRHACAEAFRQESAPPDWIDSYVLGHQSTRRR
jgi:hypothetical protein